MIFGYLQFYEKHRQMQANMDALTAAKGWASLFSALSSKGSQPVKVENYLPYPSALEQAKEGAFSDSTARLLSRLIKEQIMPPALVGVLQSIPQIKNGY